MIYDALQPKWLTTRALRTIETASARGDIACSDISPGAGRIVVPITEQVMIQLVKKHELTILEAPKQ